MDAKTEGRATASAAEKLLDNPGLTVERLPMLTVIFDRLAASCAEGMRPYSPALLTCFVNSITTDHVWDALDAYDGSIAAILYSPELDARVLVGLDRRCIFSLMEVLLGGDGQERPFDDDRNYSTLEVRVAQTVFEIAAEALQAAFDPVIASTFRLERVETRMDFTVMGRRNVLAVIAKILIQALDIGGQMFIVIPQPALTPIRAQLSRDLSSDGSASDPRWQKLMQEGVQKAGVRAVAILDELPLTLGDISGWSVGDVLPLNATAASKLRLDCRNQPLFWCELGQAKGHYTLKVAERVDLDETPLVQFLELAGEAESR
jgi:flagellar motor switch protein FliM